MEKQHKFSIWYVLLGIWVVLLIQNYLGSALAIKTIPYSQFLNLVKENRVAEVAISANQIQGKMRIDDKDPNKTELFKTLRVDPEISALLEQHNVTLHHLGAFDLHGLAIPAYTSEALHRPG